MIDYPEKMRDPLGDFKRLSEEMVSFNNGFYSLRDSRALGAVQSLIDQADASGYAGRRVIGSGVVFIRMRKLA